MEMLIYLPNIVFISTLRIYITYIKFICLLFIVILARLVKISGILYVHIMFIKCKNYSA